MNEQNTMDLAGYIEILRRRKLPFLTTSIIIFILGLAIAFVLPPVYRSEATILIERQEIPEDLVATTVTGYVQERIEGIRQRLVTYENLVEIAKDLDLFPQMREEGDIDNMVKQIRENILVAMVDIKAGNSKTTATVAFTVGYEANRAEVAQKVAAELANKYMEANRLARSEQTAEVSQFLAQEAERLRQEIVNLEKSLAKFKQEQSTQLPELLQVNMRLYEKTEGQIESSKDRILSIEDKIVALQSELSLTSPRKAVVSEDGAIIQSPSERLNALISTYLFNSARYASNHPDMIRLSREIKVLGSQSSEAAKAGELVSRLTLLKNQLLDLKLKYSDDHAEVITTEKSIMVVENELRNVNVRDTESDSFGEIPPDNPRYVSLKTQLDTTMSNLKEEQVKLDKYTQKLKEYEKRLFQTPIVERDYQSLSRDYANAKKKYAELKNKQLEARLSEQLEAGEKGERFVLEGAAYLPTSPDRPNRLGIGLLAGFLALVGGVIALSIAEYRDQSIRGNRGVLQVFGSLPIVVIPYIENVEDLRIQRNKRIVWIGMLVVLFVLTALSVYFYGASSDVIGDELMPN